VKRLIDHVGEWTRASSADAPEGDGWLLTMVGRRALNRTDLVILDAQAIDRGPVAVVKFPCRLHEGFHGIFGPAAELGA
jgi:carotenoid cleavage dioxygenase-like enzyme